MGVAMSVLIRFFSGVLMLVLAVPPLPVAAAEAPGSLEYKNEEYKDLEGVEEKISLDLKGIDLVELFRILSLKTGLTIVPSKSVTGRANILLNNLTFDEILDIVLVTQNLAKEQKGEILYILTDSEYEQLYGIKYNEKRIFKSLKLSYASSTAVFDVLTQIKSDIGKVVMDEASGSILLMDVPEKVSLMEQTARELDQPTQTEVFELKYAKHDAIETHLADAITQGTGQIYVDERSNTVVVSDLSGKMKTIKQLIEAFDTAEPQVFIQADIVQVTLTDQFQRGVNWDALLTGIFREDFKVETSFALDASLPSVQKVIVGTLGPDKFTSTIDLLQTYGDTKILSRPRIAVVNNQEASILVGSKEAYITSTQSQAESTTVTSESIEFVNVGIQLDVVPTIHPDGMVTMKIRPEVSTVRETLESALGAKVPIVETSEAETVVKVKDGTMIMIVGLMKEERRDDRSETPYLARLPIIGAFFGTRNRKDVLTELVIFLTPHIFSGVTPLIGHEPEQWIPPAIMSPDLRTSIAERLVSGELDALAKEKDPDEEEEQPSVKQLITTSASPKASKKTITDLHSKIKGVKGL
jgi:type II secretory pathway component GspD/PulD (secretin)